MKQILNLVFSIILLPVNFCCAFWLFREAMNLTGMTWKEFLSLTSGKFFAGPPYRRLRKKQRFLVTFFREKSSDPQKSIQLLWTFGICTLPGLAALHLAIFYAKNPDDLQYAFIGNLILVLVNIALVIWGKYYRKNQPIDGEIAKKLKAKYSKEKEEGKKRRVKNIVIYSIVGAVFLGILLFFMLLIAGSSAPNNSISQEDVAIVLNERGYQTAEVPVTYWDIEENSLMYVCAGVKGENKFEFYEYSEYGDEKTAEQAYRQILYRVAPEMEPSEWEKHEAELPSGNRIFTAVIDGIYHLVVFGENTLIYAYSPDSLDEINEILIQLGYLDGR